MKKQDIMFYGVMALFFALLILALVFGEIRVQQRWDKYEQRVFAEMRIEEGY